MRIRLGRRSDKRAYLRIQKEAFPTIDSRRDAKFFDEKVRRHEILVCEENGLYLGHLCFGVHRHDPPFAGSVFLEEFAVRASRRGEGIGTRLLGQLVERCKRGKIRLLLLGTGDHRGNRARAYYERLSFRKVGSLENLGTEYDHGQIFYAMRVREWEKKRR